MITGIDGIDHINVYSKGKTELGRKLTNFAYTPFDDFDSVEGWWYWYCTGKKYEHLKKLYGFKAKQEGTKYDRIRTPTSDILKQVYHRKLECNHKLRDSVINSSLPFTHYYDYSGKIVETEWVWTGELWNIVRDELREKRDMNERKFYAGIGSRNTPRDILLIISKVGRSLYEAGFWLRSGGAKGADLAFEKNVPKNKEIFTTSNSDISEGTAAYNSVASFKGVKMHGNPNALLRNGGYGHKLMARNYYQIFGNNNIPVKFVICWTPDACISHTTRNIKTGGTGQAIGLASVAEIPVFNLARPEHYQRITNWLHK